MGYVVDPKPSWDEPGFLHRLRKRIYTRSMWLRYMKRKTDQYERWRSWQKRQIKVVSRPVTIPTGWKDEFSESKTLQRPANPGADEGCKKRPNPSGIVTF